MWHGDYSFALQNLVLKDFRVRYRNMSLGAFWSLMNPLIMMTVITVVFTRVFPTNSQDYAVKLLCGLVPFNFFTLSWANGTTSLLDNSGLVKRVPVPRELFPISNVLANCLNLMIQLCVLFIFALAFHHSVNRYWLWIPVVCGLFIVFVMGLALACSALDVYLRDMRYVVESVNTILFWMVPIVYTYDRVPDAFKEIYSLNPLAAVILALQRILIEARAPGGLLMWKLALGAVLSLAAGWLLFRRLQRRIYDHL